MRPLIICYHPDGGLFYDFPGQTGLAEVAINLDMDIVFPAGRRVIAWKDGDVKGKPNSHVSTFDVLARGRKVVLCGYSRGASLANYIGSYRSEQVIAVVSYAGRLNRTRIDTTHKYPVFNLWNKKDRRINKKQFHRLKSCYRIASHPIQTSIIENGWRHIHGWDARVNPTLEDRIRIAL